MKYWIVKKSYFCTKTKSVCFYNSEFLDYNDSPDIDCSKCKLLIKGFNHEKQSQDK